MAPLMENVKRHTYTYVRIDSVIGNANLHQISHHSHHLKCYSHRKAYLDFH